MFRNVPPLRALRAFESAARHLSFTAAAEELHVTQAAVSQQIKHLETLLDTRLFRRINRRLVLTEEAQVYLPEVRESLERLSAATARLGRRRHAGALTVSVMPSFASRWLIARLPRFRQRYSDLRVRISAFEWLADFEKQDVDMAVRLGRGGWPGLHTERLMEEEIFPVCAPGLRSRLSKPGDLTGRTLLHDDYTREDWVTWLNEAGTAGIDPAQGLSFSHTDLTLEAAEHGLGVALGRTPLVDDALEQGTLVEPFDIRLKGDLAYHVVCPEAVVDYPQIRAFREWLLEEVASAR